MLFSEHKDSGAGYVAEEEDSNTAACYKSVAKGWDSLPTICQHRSYENKERSHYAPKDILLCLVPRCDTCVALDRLSDLAISQRELASDITTI